MGSSVLHVPDSLNGIVHAFHASFHDFLLNPKHSKTLWFVDEAKYHRIIAKFCLERMRHEDGPAKKDSCVGGQSNKQSVKPSHKVLLRWSRTFCVGG